MSAVSVETTSTPSRPASVRSTRTRWRRFSEQFTTFLLSLALALTVWLIAVNQENPVIQREYDERIAVAVRGLPSDLQIVQDLSRETVAVTLQGPRSSWESLDNDDFIAFIDLTGRSNGIHNVPVQVDVVDPQMRVVGIQRPELRVQLDRVIDHEVPVRVEIMDAAAFGYEWQPPLIEPMTVTVRGPETQVAQVTQARAEVFLRNAKSQVERTQAVTLQNSQGQVVPRVESVPNAVHVVVPVEQWPGRKEVAVRVNLTGQPAAGYRLSTVRVNPSTVVLTGAVDALAQVPGFIETESVSLSGATAEIQQRVQLVIPEGITVFEGSTVDVTASIASIDGGSTVRQNPVIQGLGAGLEANVALDTVDVILSGPLPLLDSLGSDDIFVILDLSGLLPGNHIIIPRVVVPTGIRSEGVLPQSVEVVIRTVDSAPSPDTINGGIPADTATDDGSADDEAADDGSADGEVTEDEIPAAGPTPTVAPIVTPASGSLAPGP